MENSLPILQRDMQRKLGRCILRLQQYERLLKSMVAGMAVAGPIEQLQAAQDERAAGMSKKTLGGLVRLFVDHHLTAEAENDQLDTSNGGGVGSQSSNTPYVRAHFAIAMSSERRVQIEADLAELVSLRNDLVHHFIERFDISDENGCRAGAAYLESCYERIDGHCQRMRAWATGLAEAKAEISAYWQSKDVEDAFVHGMRTDDAV